MAEEKETPAPEELVKLEQAKSARSTCRATGEKIAKGEWRVGIEAWRAGRNTITWQKAVPFLKNCVFETIEKGNAGTCKLSGHKFTKGETRFVCSTGEKRIFLTILSAAKVMAPILEAVAGDFSAADFQGLDNLSEEDRQAVTREFGLDKPGAPKPKPKAEPKAEPEAEADGVKEPEEEKQANGRATRKRGKPAAAKPEPAKRPRRAAAKAKQPESESESSEEEEPAEESEGEEEESGGEELGDDEVKAMEEEEEAEAAEAAETVEAENADGAHKEEAEEKEESEESEAENPEHNESDEDDLPEFERQRRATIARNQERMRALGLKELAAELMPAPKPKARPKSKGLAAKKKSAEPAGPRRASLRQQGIAADGNMISQELRNGVAVTTMGGGGGQRVGGGQAAREPEQPRERHSKEPLPFKSDDGEAGADECFLELLRRSEGSSAASSDGSKSGGQPLWKLQLREEDVAKVTANGISHIQWHPSAATPVVAAADKSGNLGLWSVDHPADSPGDGVLSFKPHGSYVSGLRWAGAGGAPVKLFSCSYDGSLRVLDAVAGRFELAVTTEDVEFSAFDCTPDGGLAIAGDNDGLVHLFDVRDNRGSVSGKPTELHARRVNTLQFSPMDEHVFVSSSADNSLAVWDTRKLTGGACKPLASATHPKTCQSAYFAPDGSGRIVSLSRDDTIRVWQHEGKAQLRGLATIRHHNNTGRWILPFRANWSPQADTIIVGNMKRSVDLYSPEGKLQGQLSSGHMTAISSRAAVHPHAAILAAATASGRVHIYR